MGFSLFKSKFFELLKPSFDLGTGYWTQTSIIHFVGVTAYLSPNPALYLVVVTGNDPV